MMRAIGSVVAGYVVMAVLVIAMLFAAGLALGPDGMYKPGTFDVSSMWGVLAVGIGLVAAVAGGFVCARIARKPAPPRALAGLVLVIGLAMGCWTLLAPASAEPAPARTADTPALDVVKYSKEPAWMCIANPLIGAVGVLIGARGRATRAAQQ